MDKGLILLHGIFISYIKFHGYKYLLLHSRRQSGTQLARQCEWSQVVSTDWITRLHIKFRSSHFDDHVTTAVHKDKYLKTKN